jgi:outer membrane murein-binding lipoprotein Lpp
MRKENIVTSFKYFIMLFMAIFLTTLVLSGCGSKGTTTKFRFTPIDSMPDGKTDPQMLTEDLDVLLQSEDSKRMKKLQEEAKAKAEKEKKPSMQKVDEIK